MGWFYRLARFFYGVKDDVIDGADLAVPLGYGFNKDRSLPDAAKKTLSEAASIAKRYKATIAWASSNYFWPKCEEFEDLTKIDYLKNIGYSGVLVTAKGIANSVMEARSIKTWVIEKRIPSNRIVVVCNWPHARSARIVWQKIFPESKIFIRNVKGNWDSSHSARLQQSNFKWLLACLLRHAALRIFGLDRVAKIQHPIQK